MAEIGLNVFQVIQNELISREGSRSSLGLGFRLSTLEERMMNIEATNRNGKVWKLHHHISPVTSLTPDARERLEKRKTKLLSRKGAKKSSDDKDPAMFPRLDERWEVHCSFPRTLLEFKELQYHPDIVRSLMEFYDIRIYRPDFKLLNIDPDDRCRDIQMNMETCLEELAMQWGINWQRIGGLSMPYPPTPVSSHFGSTAQFTPSQASSSPHYRERETSISGRSSPSGSNYIPHNNANTMTMAYRPATESSVLSQQPPQPQQPRANTQSPPSSHQPRSNPPSPPSVSSHTPNHMRPINAPTPPPPPHQS